MASSSSIERRVMERLTVPEYFTYPETLRRMELVYGFVREPPAPRYGHQSIVTRLTTLLDSHVRERALGRVCVSPIDVVLDANAALVVQPDIVFVSQERLRIVRDRVWGAPDLVVEVLSRGTESRDRTTKVDWYRRYGVRECWLVDPRTHSLEVESLTPDGRHAYFTGTMVARSLVLPGWNVLTAQIFT
jgi:Uma2 family endonuclease